MTFEAFRKAAFEAALAAGCTAAETCFSEEESFCAQVLDQQLEKYTVSLSCALGLRVQYQGRNGYAYTEQLENPEQLVARALDNARVIENTDDHPMMGPCTYRPVALPEDPCAGLSEAEKIALAMDLEKQALAADPRVDRVETALVETGHGTLRLDNTLGLSATRQDRFSLSYVCAILKQGDQVQDGAAFRVRGEVKDTAACAAEAAAEAACRFDAQSAAPGTYPVVFRYDAAADLLAAFASVFSADAAQKGLSLLAGQEGQRIASEAVTIMDDPFHPYAPRAFDDEGVPSLTKAVVEKGVLKTLLHNLKTARKAGVSSTSNASRGSVGSPVGVAPSNFYIVPGEKTREQLLADMGDGLLITEVSGLHAGLNPVSGDFSLLARGMRVENGRCTVPVEQITVAGQFLQLLKHVRAVGSDLKFGFPGSVNIASPSLLVDDIKIAGKDLAK